MIRIGVTQGAFDREWCSANNIKHVLDTEGDNYERVLEMVGWARAKLHWFANMVTSGEHGVDLAISEDQEHANRMRVAQFEIAARNAQKFNDHLGLLNAAYGLIGEALSAFKTSGRVDPGLGEGQKP